MAQPRKSSRPILDGAKQIGRAFAIDESDLMSILADIELTLKAHSPMWMEPMGATIWLDVRALHASSPKQLQCIHPLDARQGLWERYQSVRYVPILSKGSVSGTVVLSQETSKSLRDRKRRCSLSLRGKSQCLDCETKTSLFSQFLADFSQSSRFLANFSRFFSHLPGEIFRAILVNFFIFPSFFWKLQFSPGFSQF